MLLWTSLAERCVFVALTLAQLLAWVAALSRRVRNEIRAFGGGFFTETCIILVEKYRCPDGL